MTYFKFIDDSDWDEVLIINRYAIFMGYLMMGVRGLGVLVVTWTTVVLLGGFVSVLGKKDFWCLTAITLVQTAGVLNFLSRDKLGDIRKLSGGLLSTVVATVYRKGKTSDRYEQSVPRMVLALGLSALQLLVFAVILCPLAVFFVFGLYISAALSLWRLIEHDFTNADGGSNLKPALEVLYGLAVAQGILYSYRTMHYFGSKIGLVEFVTQNCSMDKTLVWEYLKDTIAGCEKDTSFATGRNLITYGVDLMAAESNSNIDSFIAGVRVLDASTPTTADHWDRQFLLGRLLTRSAASGHMIQRLLETLALGSRHYGLKEVECAARVLAYAAVNIRLLRFTEVIPFISCLLDTLELEESPKESLEVATKVARILRNLATEEDNCRIIMSAEGVLSNTVRHLVSVQDHRGYKFHDEWCSMAYELLEFISHLTGAPGGTEAVPNEISCKLQEIEATVQSILECTKCNISLKRQAVKVLLDVLYMDIPSSVTASPGTGEIFTWMLMYISALDDGVFDWICLFSPRLKKRSSMRQGLAREKLKAMVSGDDAHTLEPIYIVVGHLTRVITAQAGNNKYRLQAVQLVRHLCCNSNDMNEYQFITRKAVLEVMPELLKHMLGCGSSTSEETRAAETRPNDGQLSARSSDIEKGSEEQDASSPPQRNGEQQHMGIELQEAYISLCRVVSQNLLADHGNKLNAIAANACLEQGIPMPVKDFESLVSYAQDRLEEQKKRLAQ